MSRYRDLEEQTYDDENLRHMWSDRAERLGGGSESLGRQRLIDIWVVWGVERALNEVHLNRWRQRSPEVAEALREAREAVHRLAHEIWKAM